MRFALTSLVGRGSARRFDRPPLACAGPGACADAPAGAAPPGPVSRRPKPRRPRRRLPLPTRRRRRRRPRRRPPRHRHCLRLRRRRRPFASSIRRRSGSRNFLRRTRTAASPMLRRRFRPSSPSPTPRCRRVSSSRCASTPTGKATQRPARPRPDPVARGRDAEVDPRWTIAPARRSAARRSTPGARTALELDVEIDSPKIAQMILTAGHPDDTAARRRSRGRPTRTGSRAARPPAPTDGTVPIDQVDTAADPAEDSLVRRLLQGALLGEVLGPRRQDRHASSARSRSRSATRCCFRTSARRWPPGSSAGPVQAARPSSPGTSSSLGGQISYRRRDQADRRRCAGHRALSSPSDLSRRSPTRRVTFVASRCSSSGIASRRVSPNISLNSPTSRDGLAGSAQARDDVVDGLARDDPAARAAARASPSSTR